MTTTLPNSYSTMSIYNTVPQFIQDEDVKNGYPLWWFINGAAKLVDQLDILTRDNVGPGIHIESDFGQYQTINSNDAKLAKAVSPGDTTITIFDTDNTWLPIDTSVPFMLNIVDSLNNVNEYIEIPAGYYDWTAPFIVIEGISRGQNGTDAEYFPASTGADGSVYLQDFFGAPGWSQAVDINRCPNYALPWLAQFVGAVVQPNTTQSRQQIVQSIKQRAGFNRATVPAIVAELVAITNSQIPTSITPLSQSQIVVMENTQPQSVGGVNYYTYNPYALTLLVPTRVFSSYTYQSLQDLSGGNAATYSSTDSYITSIGGLYFSLAGSTTPSSESPYINFVYRYRPAGMQIFVGGY